MDKREKKGGDAMSVTMKTHTDYLTFTTVASAEFHT